MTGNLNIRGGEVLFASHTLNGTYFENAVILLLEDNFDGIFGIIINRESKIPLNEVFNSVSESDKRRINIGGPVDEDMVFTLRIAQPLLDGEKELVHGVSYGRIWKSSKEMISSDEKSNFLFLGYAGWKRKQLVEEIEEGSWLLYREVNVADILQKGQSNELNKRREIETYLKEKSV